MSQAADSPSLRERFLTLNDRTSRDAAALARQGEKATLWGLLGAPLLTFLKAYVGRRAWRNGLSGFIAAMFASYEVFVRHAKLWELHHTKGKIPSPPQS